MTRARLLALALLLAPASVLLLAPAPAAADPLPLSALPAKPARYGQAAGPVPAKVGWDPTRSPVTPGGPLTCLMSTAPAYWIDGDADLGGHLTSLVTDPGQPFWIERLVVRGDAAELERIAASVGQLAIVPSARSRIPLHAVARLDDLVVYAYRWDAKVFLVTRSLPGALVRTDGADGLTEAPECSFVYTQLVVRRGSSQAVQIRGTVPSTGRPYLVDASISKTSRDPEPLLSVTARLLDP